MRRESGQISRKNNNGRHADNRIMTIVLNKTVGGVALMTGPAD